MTRLDSAGAARGPQGIQGQQGIQGIQGVPGPAGDATGWAPSTAYVTGDVRIAPDGSRIRRNANGTSRATFDATEKAAWTSVLAVSGTIDNTALVLPAVGSIVYNSDGTVATGADGETYTYNSDGTVHTVTLNGVTRTYTYNPDGTIASVA